MRHIILGTKEIRETEQLNQEIQNLTEQLLITINHIVMNISMRTIN